MRPSSGRIPYLGITLFCIGLFQTRGRGQTLDAVQGAQRFMEYCAGCHGADGKGGAKAPSLVTESGTPVRPELELMRIVHDGTTGGMPPFAQIGDENIQAVVHFLRLLEGRGPSGSTTETASTTGDVNAGRSLYFGKARCATCHSIHGEGGFIARTLTTYARDRAPDAIRRTILNPDSPLLPSTRVTTVETIAGQRLTGVLRNEDNFNLVLQTEDGRYHFLTRSDVAQVGYSNHSLMPRDFASRLSASELNDIVSFLISTSKEPNPQEARTP